MTPLGQEQTPLGNTHVEGHHRQIGNSPITGHRITSWLRRLECDQLHHRLVLTQVHFQLRSDASLNAPGESRDMHWLDRDEPFNAPTDCEARGVATAAFRNFDVAPLAQSRGEAIRNGLAQDRLTEKTA